MKHIKENLYIFSKKNVLTNESKSIAFPTAIGNFSMVR